MNKKLKIPKITNKKHQKSKNHEPKNPKIMNRKSKIHEHKNTKKSKNYEQKIMIKKPKIMN